MSTYEQFAWLILPGRGAPARRADKKHHELKSFGRFWYQEIRDFLNSKRTVERATPKKCDRFLNPLQSGLAIPKKAQNAS